MRQIATKFSEAMISFDAKPSWRDADQAAQSKAIARMKELLQHRVACINVPDKGEKYYRDDVSTCCQSLDEMAEFELLQILDTLRCRNYHVVEYCHSRGWTVLMPRAGKYIYAGKFIWFCGVWVANKSWLRMAIKSATSLQWIEATAGGKHNT